MLFFYFFYQIRYMWHCMGFSLIQNDKFTMLTSLHCICFCKWKRQLLKISLFSWCSEDISKNTGVLIPHLIDPPSCPPHFPAASPRIEIKRCWRETEQGRCGGYLEARQSMLEKNNQKILHKWAELCLQIDLVVWLCRKFLFYQKWKKE